MQMIFLLWLGDESCSGTLGLWTMFGTSVYRYARLANGISSAVALVITFLDDARNKSW